MNGNFVVKRSKRRFNQVPADQATEGINKTCKMQNGIRGNVVLSERDNSLY